MFMLNACSPRLYSGFPEAPLWFRAHVARQIGEGHTLVAIRNRLGQVLTEECLVSALAGIVRLRDVASKDPRTVSDISAEELFEALREVLDCKCHATLGHGGDDSDGEEYLDFERPRRRCTALCKTAQHYLKGTGKQVSVAVVKDLLGTVSSIGLCMSLTNAWTRACAFHDISQELLNAEADPRCACADEQAVQDICDTQFEKESRDDEGRSGSARSVMPVMPVMPDPDLPLKKMTWREFEF
jgi:hypothetical protein